MNFYQQIRLTPDAEVGLGFLWTKVYTQVHLALAEYNNSANNIGISFPEYQYNEKKPKDSTIGKVIRVFAKDTDSLAKLDLRKWLKRLEDYASLSEITECPTDSDYGVFTRYQPKNQSSLRRIARRRIERLQESEQQAMNHISKLKTKKSNYPCILLVSLTNHHEYPLFIKLEKTSESESQDYSTYGLSKNGSTVPIF